MPPVDHRPRKRFGQHFLHDKRVIERIIEALGNPAGYRLVEIGPGRGALTGPLLQAADKLEVVEIDRDLAGDLEVRYHSTGKLLVHCCDVLEFDFCNSTKPAMVVGNLPYNISTPLLFHLIEHLDCIALMLLMLQKEVAQRVCAGPGGGDYGRLSVMVQSRCRVESLFSVGRGAFTPAPKVDSAVIRLCPLAEAAPAIDDRRLFEHLVRAAFAKRRKTLRNALKGLAGEGVLEAAGISPDARAQELGVEDFARLANHLGGS